MPNELDELQKDIDNRKERLKHLVTLLFLGTLTLAVWRKEMQREIEELYIQAYVLGFGGILEEVGEEGWKRLQAVLDQHYTYLDKFTRDMTAMSEAQAAARAALYAQSAYQAYSVGYEQKIGGGRLTLPAYPGDISTQCGSNCRCHWRIADRPDGGWDCFWEIEPAAESCKDCQERAANWWPLTLYPN